MASEALPESEPLQPAARPQHSGDHGYGSACTKAQDIARKGSHRLVDTFLLDPVEDVARYRTQEFSTWSSFMVFEKTVWKNPKLWQMVGHLSGVAVSVAAVTILLVRRPAILKVSKFTDVSKLLNVVTGLLLSFFFSSSIHRWYTCVNGFLELLDSIRSLQIQFIALGVPFRETCLCMRFGLTSGWLLYLRLRLESRGLSGIGKDSSIWDKIMTKQFTLSGSDSDTLVTPTESEVLRRTHDPPPMLWVWVSALVGRLAQDGIIQPMASPTYGRIMNLCQAAHAGIRQVNVSVSVQYPLIYTHMLATLVHINNLLNAVTFGIVLGLSVGTTLQHAGVHMLYPVDAGEVAGKESERDLQNVIVTFAYCCSGPIVYQALLIISMALAQPFDSEDAAIPLDRFLKGLEDDLEDAFLTAGSVAFEKPCFAQGRKTILKTQDPSAAVAVPESVQ